MWLSGDIKITIDRRSLSAYLLSPCWSTCSKRGISLSYVCGGVATCREPGRVGFLAGQTEDRGPVCPAALCIATYKENRHVGPKAIGCAPDVIRKQSRLPPGVGTQAPRNCYSVALGRITVASIAMHAIWLGTSCMFVCVCRFSSLRDERRWLALCIMQDRVRASGVPARGDVFDRLKRSCGEKCDWDRAAWYSWPNGCLSSGIEVEETWGVGSIIWVVAYRVHATRRGAFRPSHPRLAREGCPHAAGCLCATEDEKRLGVSRPCQMKWASGDRSSIEQRWMGMQARSRHEARPPITG